MKNEKRIKNSEPSLINVMKRTFVMGFKINPLLFVGFLIIDVANGILTALVPIATMKLFDAALYEHAFTANVIIAIILLTSIIVVQHVINGFNHTLIPYLKYQMDAKAIMDVQEKAGRLQPELFENKEFLDHIEKAYEGTDYSFKMLVPFLRAVFLYSGYMVVMGLYLYSLEPILAMCVVLIFLPTIFGAWIKSKYHIGLEDEIAPLRRETDHYKNCIVSREYFKETRILGSYLFFLDKYKTKLGFLLKETWKTKMKAIRIDIIANLSVVMGYLGVLYLLTSALLNGEITVTAFAAVVSSLGYMFGMMGEGIYELLQPVNGFATVRNFITFLDLPESKADESNIDFENGIKLNNVCYQYVGTDQKALADISFEIQKGQSVAIVGENGAGKTTLTRLILGLYLPSSGNVSFNGKSTSEVSQNSIYKGMSAVFQRFQKYQMSLNENIIISDNREVEEQKRIEECVEESKIDLSINNFPNGIDTILSREFGGVDLSGGQWQRVAIARGLYREHEIIVLDEPTSAIDPIEERKLYEHFVNISKNKTSVIVTHRLGAARIADIIVVLKKGHLIELGTHEELMSNAGYYKEMFDSQTKWYVRDEEVVSS